MAIKKIKIVGWSSISKKKPEEWSSITYKSKKSKSVAVIAQWQNKNNYQVYLKRYNSTVFDKRFDSKSQAYYHLRRVILFAKNEEKLK